ncbi:hypothetical protein ACNOYE_11380 [Nannocystaceae bacterium ST9]
MRFVVASGLLLAACVSPPTAPPSASSSPAPTLFVEPPLGPIPGTIRRGECPAETSEPIPYFAGRVEIRLPVGVDASNFIEYTPGEFVRNNAVIESSNCIPDMPGPLISFMAMMWLPDRPTHERPLEQIRDEVLDSMTYPSDRVLVEQAHAPLEPDGMWVYEIPPTPDQPEPEPAKILIALKAAQTGTVALIYEVHPNAWSVIVDSLVESATELRLLAP